MTPSRLPPPASDDIPRPVPGPDEPPPVDIEIDIPSDELVDDVEFSEAKTQLERRCMGCGGDFDELPNDLEPPRTHGEAWGEMGGRCRGTLDPSIWSWCRGPVGDGRLVRPGSGSETYFRDRRRSLTPVDVERRRRS